ncbi:reverse transcriptase domain-containing protein [Tanacetum coccineum]|uniref:Reverse transcriptase domain-containing protein n=1 Tax=Tanacetum coccineum TaxID=301880 RepID=A0ABQ5J773_9ASTR
MVTIQLRVLDRVAWESSCVTKIILLGFESEPLASRFIVIIEHLAKDGEKNVFWSINDEDQESLLNLKNTTYHSKRIRYFPRLRQDQDHFLSLKNMSYPHQQIHRIRYFGQHSKETHFIANTLYPDAPIRWTVFRFPPYKFAYPEKKLTMDEMLAKFINEGKREYEEMEIFIREFRTTNEFLLKEQNNLLSELKIKVHELSRVMNDALFPKHEVKGVTTRGEKMTSRVTDDNEINEANDDHNEPSGLQHAKPEKLREVVVENNSPKAQERIIQPSIELLKPSVPFLNWLRKEKKEAHQRKFLENLRQLHINIPFIKALVGDGEVVFDIEQSMKKPSTKDNEFFQIPVALEDQEKTTFTCPYGTFAYRRMPFGLCNAPATFQRCMTAIFHDMVEDFMEVSMDDLSAFSNSFNGYLTNLDKMLARCEETNLVLNWENVILWLGRLDQNLTELDTAYGRSWIRHIGNWSCAFSCEELALIRCISFLDMAYWKGLKGQKEAKTVKNRQGTKETRKRVKKQPKIKAGSTRHSKNESQKPIMKPRTNYDKCSKIQRPFGSVEDSRT